MPLGEQYEAEVYAVRIRNPFIQRIRAMCACVCALTMLCAGEPALASVAALLKADAKIYAKADKRSKVLKTVRKGGKVSVAGTKGKWARLAGGGYIAKDRLTKAGAKPAKAPAKQKKAQKKSPKNSCQRMQKRLVAKGYLKASAATGSMNAATQKAVRVFQMINGLSVSGKANASTVRKILSKSARKMPKVSDAAWGRSGIEWALHRGGTAKIIDLSTGKRINIRRVGGHNHLDVEPKTAADTARLKKVYGGTWSWDSRPILLIARGRYYAAAMNGMPHGAEISKTNNFKGQFCIHLKGSITHGTERANPLHQVNVDKVSQYFNG